MKLSKQISELRRTMRRILSRKFEVLNGDALEELRFYQFRETTARFFFDKFGRADIRCRDTPHFMFARSLVTGAGVQESEEYYREYLATSWNGRGTKDKFDDRVAEFRLHLDACSKGLNMPRPAGTRLLNSDDLFVLDGNHRVAMMAALSKPLTIEVLPPDLSMLIFSRAKEFYGTGFRDMPYQSVFLDGREVVAGRRNDALVRLQLIPESFIRGQRVLDVASNIGMSSLFAHELGAEECIGLEVSRKMVDFANRFSMFDAKYPSVQFKQFNLDEDSLSANDQFDAAFMFSIHDHLKHPDRLSVIARNNVSRCVIFEGHPKGTQENYAMFFEVSGFTRVTELGRLAESVFNRSPNRILWLCEK